MNPLKMVGLGLLAAGALALAYGGFTYTKETHETKLGPIELSVADRETVDIPIWVGVGVMVLGGGLLLLPNRL